MWRIWARALGDKPYRSKKHSDQVAIVRTIIFLSYLTTNAFIIAGVIRHWNDGVPGPAVPSSHQRPYGVYNGGDGPL